MVEIGPHQRARFLLKIADLIDKHADELAELETPRQRQAALAVAHDRHPGRG